MQRCEDNVAARLNGNALQPLSDVSVTVTDDHTGLPAALYSDNGVTQVFQPLKTDDNGYYGFYAANGEYTLTFSGIRIATFTRKIVLNDFDDNPAVTKAELAAGSGSTLVTFTQAGTGAVMRSLQARGRDFINVKDFGAVGDGVTDDTAAVQAALNASTNLHAPAGTYKINGTLSKALNGAFRLTGDGIGITVFHQYADADLFSFTSTAGSSQVTVERMDLRPRVDMTTGAAINVRNDTALPSLLVRDVFIGQSSTYEFKYGIKATNCTEALFERVVQYGLGTGKFIPWYITSTKAATVPKWLVCSAYNAQTGAMIVNASSPGVEGSQFYGCDLVNVQDGVVFQNTYGTAYFPPQLTWIGGHINATRRNFDLSTMAQAVIHDALLYNTGSADFIRLATCSGYSVSNTKCININQSGTATGIRITNSTGPINGGVISNNYFELAPAANCIDIDATQPLNNLTISGNVRAAGTKTLNVSAGYLSGSVVLRDNTTDSDDLEQVIGPVGPGNAWFSLTGLRSDYYTVNGIGSAASITTFISRRAGEVVTLKFADATITLQHNPGSANGFSLKGAANFNFPAGSFVVLRRMAAGYWQEVSRSV